MKWDRLLYKFLRKPTWGGFIILLLLLVIAFFTYSIESSRLTDNPVSNQINEQFKIEYKYKVIKVTDGDTIRVEINGQNEAVRLVGMDAPETNNPNVQVECYGPEAKAKLEEMLLGKMVYLYPDFTQGDTDRYGRKLRHVWVTYDNKQTYVNAYLTEHGFATLYTSAKNDRYEQIKSAQETAMKNKAGLWAACEL